MTTAQSKMVSEANFSLFSDIVPLLQALRVCVTGAAGQIAYSLLYSVAKGDVFGADQVRCSSNTLVIQGNH